MRYVRTILDSVGAVKGKMLGAVKDLIVRAQDGLPSQESVSCSCAIALYEAKNTCRRTILPKYESPAADFRESPIPEAITSLKTYLSTSGVIRPCGGLWFWPRRGWNLSPASGGPSHPRQYFVYSFQVEL